MKMLAKLFVIPFLIALLIWGVLPLPSAYGSDNTMTIRGYISDERNNPVTYHLVEYYLLDEYDEPVDGTRKTANTNGEGIYSFSISCYPNDLNKKFLLKTQNPGVAGAVSKYIGNFNIGTVNWDFNITRYGTTVIHVRDENGAPVPSGVPMWFSYSSPSSSGSSWPWNSPADGDSPHHETDGNGNISLFLRAAWYYDGEIGSEENPPHSLGGFSYGYAAGERAYGGIHQAYNMVDLDGVDHTSDLRYELPSDPNLRDDVIDISSQAGKTRELTFYVRPLGKVVASAKDGVTSEPLRTGYWDYSSESGFVKYSDYINQGSGFSTYGYGGDTITITVSDPSNPITGDLGHQSASASAVARPWGVETVTLVLQPNSAGTINGRVVDSSGNGIPDATVELLWPGGYYSAYAVNDYQDNYSTLKNVTTNGDGYYTFTDVVPSSGERAYRIRVTKPDFNMAMSEDIMLTSGETENLSNLTLALDTQPPYWDYGQLEIASIGWSGAMLEWPEASDDTGVAGYKLYEGEALLADTGTNYVSNYGSIQYKLSDLEPNTTYNLSVKAYDASGNLGEPLSASFTTLTPYDPTLKVIRASVNRDGLEANEDSQDPVISSDGRFVAFSSDADNLCEGDNNNTDDVFLFNCNTGELKCLSLTPNASTGDWSSYSPAISADGRYVAFVSGASDLVENDTNNKTDIFVYDTSNDVLKMVSTGLNNEAANGNSDSPSLSSDGRYITFSSSGSNLVENDTNGKNDIFVVDMNNGTTTRASYQLDGSQVTGSAGNPVMSANGRFIAYEIYVNYNNSIYVYDSDDKTTKLVTKRYANPEIVCRGYNPSISADGRYITFYSGDSNLVESDYNSKEDVFVFDQVEETMQLVSLSNSGDQGNNYSTYPAISSNGRFVAFKSRASNLVSDDSNDEYDVFIRDLLEGTTERVSLAADETEGNADSSWNECPPAISAEGQYIVFDSYASNLVRGDDNGDYDIFIYDRGAEPVEALTITQLDSPLDIHVGYGTPIDQVSLPAKVLLTLSDSSQTEGDVRWNTEGYDGNQAGEYVIAGSLVNLPQNITNPLGLGVELKVIVESQSPVISSIEIIGEDKVTIPREGEANVSVTYTAKVNDQMGNEMMGEGIVWTLAEPVTGVSIDDNQVIITDKAQAGTTFTVIATSETDSRVKAELEVTLEAFDECFIATAAYGSKLAPAVTLLRQFRDQYLLSNAPGQAFVTFYYSNSPSVAKVIADNVVLKFIVKIGLLPVIGLAWALMNYEIILMILVLGVILRAIQHRRLRIFKI